MPAAEPSPAVAEVPAAPPTPPVGVDPAVGVVGAGDSEQAPSDATTATAHSQVALPFAPFMRRKKLGTAIFIVRLPLLPLLNAKRRSRSLETGVRSALRSCAVQLQLLPTISASRMHISPVKVLF